MHPPVRNFGIGIRDLCRRKLFQVASVLGPILHPFFDKPTHQFGGTMPEDTDVMFPGCVVHIKDDINSQYAGWDGMIQKMEGDKVGVVFTTRPWVHIAQFRKKDIASVTRPTLK
eukprot:g16942.t1